MIFFPVHSSNFFFNLSYFENSYFPRGDSNTLSNSIVNLQKRENYDWNQGSWGEISSKTFLYFNLQQTIFWQKDIVLVAAQIFRGDRLPVQIFVPLLQFIWRIERCEYELQRHFRSVVERTESRDRFFRVNVSQKVTISLSQELSQLIFSHFTWLK